MLTDRSIAERVFEYDSLSVRYARFLGLAGVIVLALAAVGALPTRRLAGEQAWSAMVVGCLLLGLASSRPSNGQAPPQPMPATGRYQMQTVVAVNTLHVHRKVRRERTRYRGYRSGWKKAIVTLAPGQRIEIFEGV